MSQRLKSVSIFNYKSLKKTGDVVLNVPNNSDIGSGLTVLVGENNSGKTAFIGIPTKLSTNQSINKEERFAEAEVRFTFKDNDDQTISIYSTKDNSKIKKDGKEVHKSIITERNFEVVKSNRVWTSSVNNPRLTQDTYDFSSNFKRELIDNQLASVLSNLKSEPGEKIFNEIIRKVIPEFKNWSVNTSRGTTYVEYSVSDKTNTDIDHALGDGILNLFRIALALVSDKIIFLDEPEAYLHPQAQVRLSSVISEFSKSKQIVMSTHSPYMLDGVNLFKTRVLHFKLIDGETEIKPMENLRSNSVAEISYKVYGVESDEYHNFLYDRLREQFAKVQEGKIKDPTSIGSFDEMFLHQRKNLKKQFPEKNNTNVLRTLPTYVRNCIHYPVNKTDDFKEKLKESIQTLETYTFGDV